MRSYSIQCHRCFIILRQKPDNPFNSPSFYNCPNRHGFILLGEDGQIERYALKINYLSHEYHLYVSFDLQRTLLLNFDSNEDLIIFNSLIIPPIIDGKIIADENFIERIKKLMIFS